MLEPERGLLCKRLGLSGVCSLALAPQLRKPNIARKGRSRGAAAAALIAKQEKQGHSLILALSIICKFSDSLSEGELKQRVDTLKKGKRIKRG